MISYGMNAAERHKVESEGIIMTENKPLWVYI